MQLGNVNTVIDFDLTDDEIVIRKGRAATEQTIRGDGPADG